MAGVKGRGGVKGRSGVPRTRAHLLQKVAAGKASAVARAVIAATRTKSANELAREAADLRFAEARARQAERDDALAASQVVTKAQAIAAAAGVRDEFIDAGERLPALVVARLPKLGKSERDQVEAAVRASWNAERARLAQRR